ncbi:hypothetical protein CsSME_00002307 [Camellia sinensis var. sinensis]
MRSFAIFFHNIVLKKMVLRAGGVNLPGVGTGLTTTAETPTKVLCLTELIIADELMDNGEYEEILEDRREEWEKCGVLVNVIIPRPSPNGGEQVPGVGKYKYKKSVFKLADKKNKGLNKNKNQNN